MLVVADRVVDDSLLNHHLIEDTLTRSTNLAPNRNNFKGFHQSTGSSKWPCRKRQLRLSTHLHTKTTPMGPSEPMELLLSYFEVGGFQVTEGFNVLNVLSNPLISLCFLQRKNVLSGVKQEINTFLYYFMQLRLGKPSQSWGTNSKLDKSETYCSPYGTLQIMANVPLLLYHTAMGRLTPQAFDTHGTIIITSTLSPIKKIALILLALQFINFMENFFTLNPDTHIVNLTVFKF